MAQVAEAVDEGVHYLATDCLYLELQSRPDGS